MTFGEIYTRVMWLLYGDTNYPQSTQQHMQSMQQGVIVDAHRKVQQDYDYWFMEHQAVYHRVYGETVFKLPDDFKTVKAVRIYDIVEEMSSADNVSIDNDGIVVGITVPNNASYKQSALKIGTNWYIIASVGEQIIAYPRAVNIGYGTLYRIDFAGVALRKQVALQKAYDMSGAYLYFTDNNNLCVTHRHGSDQLIELIYYKYYIPSGRFEDYRDPVTDIAYDAIIYYAVELEERRRREFDAANYYRQLALDEVQRLKKEHIARRNTNIINYVGD